MRDSQTELEPQVTLRLLGVRKTFGRLVALDDVSFEVRRGEVHALLGENGAGKSTLMAVAAGAIAPDAGTVEICGHRLERADPRLAQAMGLSVVYQHPSVVDDLTVAENLALSVPKVRRPSYRGLRAWAVECLAVVDAHIDPRRRVGELSVAERQLLEIAKALAAEARVVVLDEPTESLTATESRELFAQIERVRRTGTSVVYISHRLPEVRRVAERITVLRDGQVRATADARELSDEEVLRLIVGRPVEQTFPEKGTDVQAGEEVPTILEVAGLTGHKLSGVSFSARQGEIVGLAGVEGNGQRDAIRALAGLVGHHGTVRVRGREIDTKSPARARRAGIVYVPHDRHREGLFGAMSVKENLSLLVLREVESAGVLRHEREEEFAGSQIDTFDIRPPRSDMPAANLSGGNQQKVVMARAIAAEPVVLLADEPSRGVDVGARIEIYNVLRRVADGGAAVVIVSADAMELAGLCDRVLVFSRGQIVESLAGDDLSEERITGAAITAQVERAEPGARREERGKLRRAARSDASPGVILALLVVGLALGTGVGHSLFFGSRNVNDLLFLATILCLGGIGQLTVLLRGSFDLSVGPMMGLTVVIMSFFATSGAGLEGLLVGGCVAAGAGVLVGVTNAFLIRSLGIGPVISTIVTYIGLQGVSLLLRPQSAGPIGTAAISAVQVSAAAIPVVFLVTTGIAIVAEVYIRRTQRGRELRAVGSDEERAFRMGAHVGPSLVLSHVVCSLFAVGAGILLTTQVGIGDPTIGASYTLTTLAAAVLGGASIFGGRGSYVGAFLGGLLIQEAITSTSFLGLPQAWSEWLPGVLILGGAALYSHLRKRASGETVAELV
ncbi:MAG: ATP-binding cassette domain-containing protein [Actinomycetota bacterium]|nr:ATP-binding cassette domain-containing protein [Actinomycetota bacterium]